MRFLWFCFGCFGAGVAGWGSVGRVCRSALCGVGGISAGKSVSAGSGGGGGSGVGSVPGLVAGGRGGGVGGFGAVGRGGGGVGGAGSVGGVWCGRGSRCGWRAGAVRRGARAMRLWCGRRWCSWRVGGSGWRGSRVGWLSRRAAPLFSASCQTDSPRLPTAAAGRSAAAGRGHPAPRLTRAAGTLGELRCVSRLKRSAPPLRSPTKDQHPLPQTSY